MREIRFRVWDKAINRIHICGKDVHDSIIFLGNRAFYYNLQNGEGSGPDGDYVLMQHTGLKDKNGKEIYEGDILSNGQHINWIVFFDEASFKVKHEGAITRDSWVLRRDMAENREIIGNIYAGVSA